jgi:hypothetical protein
MPASSRRSLASPPPPAFLRNVAELNSAPLAAPEADRLPLPRRASADVRALAETWNRYGGVLMAVCRRLQLPPEAALAVLCIESAGRAFEELPVPRMVIRFEPQVFFDRWGCRSAANRRRFRAHFRFAPQERWQGHAFRAQENARWRAVHTNQKTEWAALELAQSLDPEEALCSTSMGLAQIMGFHWKRLGFSSASQMFALLGSTLPEPASGSRAGERQQLLSFFDFLATAGTPSPLLAAIRRQDFVQFARMYNGPGRAQEYARQISRTLERLHSVWPDFPSRRHPGHYRSDTESPAAVDVAAAGTR